MPNFHDIERRIKSVISTRQITSTMRMIAAAKVGKTASRLEKSKPYTEAICMMLEEVSKSAGESSFELLKPKDTIRTSLIIVVVSDKGLAGGFNSGVLHLAEKRINQNSKAGINTKIIICGKKAKSYFNFRNVSPEMEFIGSSDSPQFEQAEKIGNYCIESFLDDSVDEVVLIYNKCKNSMEQVIQDSVLLPVSSEKLQDMIDAFNTPNSSEEDLSKSEQNKNNKISGVFEYEPSKTEVLSGLVPLYIRTVIYNSLLDSAAGEQVARRVAMQNATDNANEMVETLTRLYNSVRQGAITTEINEIVGGAEALSVE